MARGVYLIGSKLARRVRAVQIMDCAGNSATLRLRDYLSRKIQPEYEVLPWHGLADVFFKTDSGLLAATSHSAFKAFRNNSGSLAMFAIPARIKFFHLVTSIE